MRSLSQTVIKITGWIILFLSLSTSLGAQRIVVDSLLKELQVAVEDTNKINILLELAWTHHNSNPQQTIDYGQRALDLSEAMDFKRGKAKGLNLIGIGYELQGELNLALDYFNLALAQAEFNKDNRQIRSCLNNQGLIYERWGSYNKAMECYHRALQMTNEETEKEHACVFLNNIGLIHSHQGDHDKALVYLERALAMDRELGDKLGISSSLANIGEEYRNKKELDKALTYFEEALGLSKEIDDKLGISNILCNIGSVHLEGEMYELAEEYFPQSLSIAKEIGNKEGISSALMCMGKASQKKGNYYQSNRYCLESLEIAQQMNAKNQEKEIYEILSQNYVAMGQYEKAYQAQRLYTSVSDSLYNQQKSRQILELSAKYETTRKDTENQLLKEQQAKNEAVIQRRTVLGWAVALILILVTVIAFILFKSNQQKRVYNQQLEKDVANRTLELETSNDQLKKSNKELERFAYIASHDLKEPLRNIVSFTRLIERRLPTTLSPDVKEYLNFVITNSRQMHILIEDVLEFSRVENSRLTTSEVNLNEVMGTVLGMINSSLTERDVELDIGLLPTVKANASHLCLVFKNLIENGIKYNDHAHPCISISCAENGDFHEIIVRDNGIGIAPEYYDRIFEMFNRLHNREEYQGSGLGLSICKKIITTYGGDIRVNSEPGKGSSFIFTLPMLQKKKEAPLLIAEEISS